MSTTEVPQTPENYVIRVTQENKPTLYYAVHSGNQQHVWFSFSIHYANVFDSKERAHIALERLKQLETQSTQFTSGEIRPVPELGGALQIGYDHLEATAVFEICRIQLIVEEIINISGKIILPKSHR